MVSEQAITLNVGVGEVVIARYGSTGSEYWARVLRVYQLGGSGEALYCDVEWLRPVAGQPSTGLYACHDGRDETRGRVRLRLPEDLRAPEPDDLTFGSVPAGAVIARPLDNILDLERGFTADIPEEESIRGHSPVWPHASGKATPGAHLASCNELPFRHMHQGEQELLCGMYPSLQQASSSIIIETGAAGHGQYGDPFAPKCTPVSEMPDTKVLSLPELPPVPRNLKTFRPGPGRSVTSGERVQPRPPSGFMSFILYTLQLESTCCASPSDHVAHKAVVVL
eukprot:TRINITY_DN45592_c0_g1_i1.p1 TRINITY_DN45592_c0_g1~~TRINITY_DN45592_c0_g1_i1.p1  ORF type:complete len:281 (-),score=27.93 TRINITY_DN45592_c0_g1_i1:118-960(-)